MFQSIGLKHAYYLSCQIMFLKKFSSYDVLSNNLCSSLEHIFPFLDMKQPRNSWITWALDLAVWLMTILVKMYCWVQVSHINLVLMVHLKYIILTWLVQAGTKVHGRNVFIHVSVPSLRYGTILLSPFLVTDSKVMIGFPFLSDAVAAPWMKSSWPPKPVKMNLY